ncbi:MAG TPA: hypothetical protein VNU97_01985 [Rhizomicrobium sp.]|jgi:hypothetical protein|nr:hypothetical protein [Rhizomicrobium sp.]
MAGPWIPLYLPINKLPKEEMEHAKFVRRLLMSLDVRCAEFESALALFDFCREHARVDKDDISPLRQRALRWIHIAGQAAATVVFLFHEDMTFIGKNLNLSPTLNKMLDHTDKRAATRKFSQYFPGFAGVRHSGQHNAKLYGSAEGMAEHASGPNLIVSSINGRTLGTTFRKTQATLDITFETHAKLIEVRNLYWAVFRPLDPDEAKHPPGYHR